MSFENQRLEYDDYPTHGTWDWIVWLSAQLSPIFMVIFGSMLIYVFCFFKFKEIRHEMRRNTTTLNHTSDVGQNYTRHHRNHNTGGFRRDFFRDFGWGDTLFTNDEIRSGHQWVFSDPLLKTNINAMNLTSNREKLGCIDFVTFLYAGHLATLNPGIQYGVVADQFARCFPELVRSVTLGGSPNLIVNMNTLIPIIGKEVQELITERHKHRVVIKFFQLEIVALQKRVSSLEQLVNTTSKP